MAMNFNNGDLDERKLDTIKLRILDLETDNIVKKDPKSVMVDKIYNLVVREVDKK